MNWGPRRAVVVWSLVGVFAAAPAGAQDPGAIVAWGHNDYGQCNVPAPNGGFVAVAAGLFHSLGVKADGSLVSWGWNEYGQCNVPAPNMGFVGVAGGGIHSLGLKAVYTPGDLNCDGAANFDDINPFVLALYSHAQYQQQYPDCDWHLGDINNDGFLDFDDINPFVALLSGR